MANYRQKFERDKNDPMILLEMQEAHWLRFSSTPKAPGRLVHPSLQNRCIRFILFRSNQSVTHLRIRHSQFHPKPTPKSHRQSLISTYQMASTNTIPLQ